MPPTIKGQHGLLRASRFINGRRIERGLYSKVFGRAPHPSRNRFLAQIDLRGARVAFPQRRRRRTPLSRETRARRRSSAGSALMSGAETSRESLESRLVGKLAEKKAAESDTPASAARRVLYRTIGLQGEKTRPAGEQDRRNDHL